MLCNIIGNWELDTTICCVSIQLIITLITFAALVTATKYSGTSVLLCFLGLGYKKSYHFSSISLPSGWRAIYHISHCCSRWQVVVFFMFVFSCTSHAVVWPQSRLRGDPPTIKRIETEVPYCSGDPCGLNSITL